MKQLAERGIISRQVNRAGAQLLDRLHTLPERTLSVGDMVHDYELAQVLGTHCVLLPNGQQSEERLRKTGAFVEKDLAAIPTLIMER